MPSIAEPADNGDVEVVVVERTQTDRINNQLLKSFLTRINTDPVFQNVVAHAQSGSEDQPAEQEKNQEFN